MWENAPFVGIISCFPLLCVKETPLCEGKHLPAFFIIIFWLTLFFLCVDSPEVTSASFSLSVLWSVLWSPVSCPSPQALALPFTITAPFPHIVHQEDRGVILSLFLFLSTSSFQMHVSLPGGRFLSCSDANLNRYYLGHFTVMKYFKCNLIPASNVKTSEELPACITLLLLLHLPPLLSSIQVPISFYPWNAPPPFFLIPASPPCPPPLFFFLLCSLGDRWCHLVLGFLWKLVSASVPFLSCTLAKKK